MNRILKNRGFAIAAVNALLVSFLLTFDWQSPNAQDLNDRADGVAQKKEKKEKEDPCDKLPEARGRAVGHQRKCRGGSSSGISRGDFNGDGFADLAVGAPGKNAPASVESSGAVYVIYGSATGLLPEGGNGIPATQFWRQNAAGIPGTSEEDDHFGSALAAGEFNGDLYSDLAIGVPGEDTGGLSDVGRVVVIYGSAAGLTATDPGVLSAQSFDIRTASVNFDEGDKSQGSALAWGDFDGDTVGDLAIGAPGATLINEFNVGVNFEVVSEAGKVIILFGSQTNGLTTERTRTLDQDHLGPIEDSPELPEDNDHFGEVLTAGDYDGDQITDLAVASPGEDRQGLENIGIVQLFLSGDPAGSFPRQLFVNDFVASLPEDDDHFGESMASGDFNLDGRTDLAIGVPKRDVGGVEDAGMVCITSGRRPLRVLTQSNLFANASETFDKFGSALAAGNFNGDGSADLAVGVPFEDLVVNGETVRNAGEVNVVYGSAQGLRIGAGLGQRFFQGVLDISFPDDEDRFGTSLSAWNFGRNQTLRDLNGQPFIFRTTDLAIGVPFEDLFSEDGELHPDTGAIHVLYGGLNGLTTANNQFFHQGNIGGFTNTSFDRFGRFLY